jgi:NCS1 family nucleobase:cation symporter-1
VSWLLMFADYSRYTRSAKGGAVAVFLSLALTSVWFMLLGLVMSRVAGVSDPGAMLAVTGMGVLGAVLLTLATLTTNFVNIYMSSLAWKSLLPRTPDQASVWSIGLIGAALSLLSTAWIDRYADFMLLLGGLLVPVGGILIAHFVVRRSAVQVEELYAADGRYARGLGVSGAGAIAWAGGAATYLAAQRWGSTIPALVVAAGLYLVLSWRRDHSSPASPKITRAMAE